MTSERETGVAVDPGSEKLFGTHFIIVLDGDEQLRLEIPPSYTHDRISLISGKFAKSVKEKRKTI